MQNLTEKELATAWHLQELLCSVDTSVSPLHTARYLVSEGVTFRTFGEWKWRKVRKQEAPDIGDDWYDDDELYCTACNTTDDHGTRANFCPHCGAEMLNAISKGGTPIESDAE
ncbi:MAG: hypothetical protein IJZ68_08505 [Bacteroidaceae bacterium]|nr:hypothetical protein [Bacteroidaceae bacterium]